MTTSNDDSSNNPISSNGAMSRTRAYPGATRRLAELLAEAGAQARARQRQVLVSVVEPANIDPLNALETLERRAALDATLAEHAMAGRMYWTRPSDGFAIAGLGAVVTLSPTGPTRFAAVDRAWTALLEDALVTDPSDAAPGVGPVLMGGFAFDPEGPRAAHWLGFPSALLVLPRMQVTAIGGGCWVTTTILVGPDGAPDIAPAALAQLRACAFGPTPRGSGAAAPSATYGSLTFDDVRPATEWRALVGTAVAAIRAGRMEKVVLARAVRAGAARDLDVVAMLRHLRSAYADCHVFGCWRGTAAFVGASPERLVRLEGEDVRASGLAGSAPRGTTPEEDAAFAAALLANAKDRAEHAMVRRALFAGLAELCDDVIAPAEPSLFTLPHVHHLHTAVRARLRAGHSLLDLVARLHPTPAVGGAPRDAALQFIRHHEGLDRGWYAAPIGWIGRERGELAVALRSALVRGREAWLFAGSGVVADSDPEWEYAETMLKLRPMELALAAALAVDGAGAIAEPVSAGAGDAGAR